MRDAVAKINFQSLYGRIAFGSTGQIAMPQTVIQVQNGKLAAIYGTGFLTKPLYPLPAWNKRS